MILPIQTKSSTTDLVLVSEDSSEEDRSPAVPHPPGVHGGSRLQQPRHHARPGAGVGHRVVQGGLLHTVNLVWGEMV